VRSLPCYCSWQGVLQLVEMELPSHHFRLRLIDCRRHWAQEASQLTLPSCMVGEEETRLWLDPQETTVAPEPVQNLEEEEAE
jgi:hypothetical protein